MFWVGCFFWVVWGVGGVGFGVSLVGGGVVFGGGFGGGCGGGDRVVGYVEGVLRFGVGGWGWEGFEFFLVFGVCLLLC